MNSDRGINKLKGPLLIVNPKAYLYGDKVLELLKLVDELAGKFKITTIYTAQHADLRLVKDNSKNLIITAQHLDGIEAGRGMGKILPESLVAAGAQAVVLNHAENPLTLAELDKAMKRAKEVGLWTIVCADSAAQCEVIANLAPDAMICEPSSQIGTGQMDAGDYIERTTAIVKAINPNIQVIQAAGVSTGEDVAKVLELGADGSGGTSGIIKHPNWRQILEEMYTAIAKHAQVEV